jgi:hypothetical protein
MQGAHYALFGRAAGGTVSMIFRALTVILARGWGRGEPLQ